MSFIFFIAVVSTTTPLLSSTTPYTTTPLPTTTPCVTVEAMESPALLPDSQITFVGRPDLQLNLGSIRQGLTGPLRIPAANPFVPIVIEITLENAMNLDGVFVDTIRPGNGQGVNNIGEYRIMYKDPNENDAEVSLPQVSCSVLMSHSMKKPTTWSKFSILMPPFEKGGHIALHLSVGMSVCRSVGMSVGRSVCR